MNHATDAVCATIENSPELAAEWATAALDTYCRVSEADIADGDSRMSRAVKQLALALWAEAQERPDEFGDDMREDESLEDVEWGMVARRLITDAIRIAAQERGIWPTCGSRAACECGKSLHENLSRHPGLVVCPFCGTLYMHRENGLWRGVDPDEVDIPDGLYFAQPEGAGWEAIVVAGGNWRGTCEANAGTHQAAGDAWAGAVPDDLLDELLAGDSREAVLTAYALARATAGPDGNWQMVSVSRRKWAHKYTISTDSETMENDPGNTVADALLNFAPAECLDTVQDFERWLTEKGGYGWIEEDGERIAEVKA